MDARDNLLLRALPEQERAALLAHSKVVSLALGEVLYEQDEQVADAYFLTSGAVSVLIQMKDGRALEPAIIGREGMLGFPIGLGDNRSRWRSVVQVAGEAVVIPRDELSEHLRQPGNLGALLAHYAGLLITFAAQSAACAQFHTLEQRTARWILIMQDRSTGDDVRITHDYLAYMLGSHRPSESVALEALRRLGLIDQSRGAVRVLDRAGLEAAVCECYERVENDYRELVKVAEASSVGEGGSYQGSQESAAPV